MEEFLAQWHRFAEGEAAVLDGLLADDAVFYSPVVFAPQKGRELTAMYLRAAFEVFGAAAADGGFHYTKQVVAPPHAVLEFEVELEGVLINGVDIISLDSAGRVAEFKVMVRPLRAIDLLKAKMMEMLQKLQAAAPAQAG